MNGCCSVKYVLVFTARLWKKVNCVFASHGYLTSIDRYTIPRTWLPVIPKAYDVPPPIPWPWSPSRWMKLWREWHGNAQVGRDLFDRYCKMFSWCINLFNSNAGIPTFYNLASFCGRIVNAKLLNEYLQLFARKMTTMVTQARARGWKKQSRPRGSACNNNIEEPSESFMPCSALFF